MSGEESIVNDAMNQDLNSARAIQSGTAVIVVLHTPREKCWGVIDKLNTAGVFLRGLDLNSFEDWVQAVVHQEQFVGFGDIFFPMWRIERISRDESAGGIPSLCEQVERRTGRSIAEVIASEGEPTQ
jgi:hypothetical protein